MSDFDNLKFTIELLELMIELFEDFEFKAINSENIKRFNLAKENLRKAYVYASPIIERGI